PDSTIKAIEAMDAPCHLIAGGYEKNSDFTEMLEIGKGKISSLSLIGVTAERIRKRAVELGYHAEAIGIYATLKEAVHGAFSNA
ncbi:MAG: UDP-N-acetylmuramoyl-L-alanine--D-glutamate ligase, partial [Bacillota bacterium]|nr:UDP-N-acetylmuramoyl-L-alanine--D-glutamate ligase [Bacillota bacterium]